MSLLDAFRVAIRAIAANGLRSVLTTLGMVIGVGSVIVLVAVGQGAQKGVQDSIRGLGQDLIFLQPAAQAGGGDRGGARGAAGSGNSLTQADADALGASGIPGIKAVAPQDSGNAQLISTASNQQATIIGATDTYPAARGVTVSDGTFITTNDLSTRALTIVLGPALAAQLFPDGDAVGQQVRISRGPNNINLKVEGVTAPKGGSGGGVFDSYAYVPLTTLLQRLQNNRGGNGQVFVDQINIQTAPGVNQAAMKAAVTDFLVNRHNVSTPDFTIQSQDDLLGAAGSVSRTLSILLGSIAGISLVVGAIGVMNIMLVSVTERTREIGIRRAVGARGRDIVLQFVTEALALCIGGGLLGTFIGVALALGIDGRDVAGDTMHTVVQPWSIAVAFGVAAGIGFLSGSYPAYRASRLDPIVALRNE